MGWQGVPGGPDHPEDGWRFGSGTCSSTDLHANRMASEWGQRFNSMPRGRWAAQGSETMSGPYLPVVGRSGGQDAKRRPGQCLKPQNLPYSKKMWPKNEVDERLSWGLGCIAMPWRRPRARRMKSGGPQLDGEDCLTEYSSVSAETGRLQTTNGFCHRPIGRAACRGRTGQSAMHSAGWPCEGTGRELRKTCCIRCIFVHTGSKLNSRMNTNTMNNVTNESATTTMGGQEGVRQNVSSQVSRSGVVLVDEGEVPWVQCAGREWGGQQGTAQSGSLGRRVMGGRVKGDGGCAGEGQPYYYKPSLQARQHLAPICRSHCSHSAPRGVKQNKATEITGFNFE